MFICIQFIKLKLYNLCYKQSAKLDNVGECKKKKKRLTARKYVKKPTICVGKIIK